MGYIVAIGGGDNGWGHSRYETQKADDEIIRLVNKETPNFLFIGFAAKVPEEYYKIMCGIFSKYNCNFKHLDNSACEKGYAKDFINEADIIYVGGGNTYKLMWHIRRYGLDTLLRDVYEQKKDTVFCGVSAGAICWCKYGNSATRYNEQGECVPVRVRGLDLLNILYCPHCTRDSFRAESTKKMLKRSPRLIGLEMDYAAIEIKEDSFKIIALDERSVVKKKYWERGKYYSKILDNSFFLPLENIYMLDGKEECK